MNLYDRDTFSGQRLEPAPWPSSRAALALLREIR